MDDTPPLKATGVGKKFSRDLRTAQRYGVLDIIGELDLRQRTEKHLRNGEFWALSGIDLEVQRGEAVAVIGHNGAGKSTLLRILSGLLVPDRGRAQVAGTTAAMLDLTAPIEGVLTARENITTAAALLGVRDEAVPDLVERVIDFAELHDFVDSPVRTFSTGMQMRLGFALAIQSDPDVLLVDEVIAVGDIAFQRKCIQRIHRFVADGGALLLVTHDMWMAQALSSRCIVMSEGRVIEDTSPAAAIGKYLAAAQRPGAAIRREDDTALRTASVESAPTASSAELPATIELSAISTDTDIIQHGCRLEATMTVTLAHGTATATLDLMTANSLACLARLATTRVEAGRTTIKCTLPELELYPGVFQLVARVDDPQSDRPLTDSVTVLLDVSPGESRHEFLAQVSGVLSRLDCTFAVADSAITEPPPTSTSLR